MRKSICYRVIYRFQDKYPLHEICQIFGVSYSGYYKWRKRQQQSDRDEALIEMIQDRFKASNHSAGYRQLTLQLQKHYGVTVNHKVVYRIMKRLGIQSVARRRRSYNKYSDAIHRYENVLKRDFKAEQCNQKWATDITYVQTK